MELTDILQQIDSLKQEAENLQPVKPDPIAIGLEKVFWDKFRLEFNYNSNHMEGNTLTYGHTQILLKSGDVVGKYNIRELQEMKAHDLALKVIRESADDPEFSLSQKFIREINEIILVEPYYNDAITQDGRPSQKLIIPGEYKKTPNSVRMQNGEMFDYPSPEETPALMGDLIDWYEKETTAKELHPVQIAALFHYKIVRIHPFDDSNGRTSRLLMNYILLRNDYAPLVINSTDKKNYLIALNEADAGDIGAFVKYIVSLQLHWQELFLRAVKGETIEEADDFEKEVAILKKKISKKNEVEPIKTKEVVQKTLLYSIIPFLEGVEKILKKFNEFFFEQRIIIQNFNQGVSEIKELENPAHRLATHLATNQQITIQFFHLGLIKEGKRDINYCTSIKLVLKEYDYRIEVDQINESIKKKYNQLISLDEIKLMSEKIAKKELEMIKNNM